MAAASDNVAVARAIKSPKLAGITRFCFVARKT